MRCMCFLALMAWTAGFSPGSEVLASELPGSEPMQRPNILLIVADDLGYADIGAYGGEINTPNLDQLAEEGARFTSFYTQASCSPTRSILLTGVDNHRNGLGTMAEDRLPHQHDLPGYVGYLNQQVVTVAQLLKDGGYHTYISGKWHLGIAKAQRPANRGFEKSYVLLHGGGNHFNDNGNNSKRRKVSYASNGKLVQRPSNVYSSDLFTDKLLAFLKADNKRAEKKPFFAYLAFTAPHFPLQAPVDLIQKYISGYASGWDKIRAQRFQGMKNVGLIENDQTLPPRLNSVPAWDSLGEPAQKLEAKKMAVYAAMVDSLDANIGRVIDHLKTTGQYENTIILFLSDNGADPYDRSHRQIYRDFFSDGYVNTLENMGNANSYFFNGTAWAQVASVYQKDYKFLLSQGGIHAPLIMRYPGQLDKGGDKVAFASVYDITPTLLEFAGVAHPGKRYQGRVVSPLQGRSMLNYLYDRHTSVYTDKEPIAFELFGHGAVFMGDYKALKIRPPQGDDQWRLYNLRKDPGELQDLAGQKPELLVLLKQYFSDYMTANHIISEPDGVTAYPEVPRYTGGGT